MNETGLTHIRLVFFTFSVLRYYFGAIIEAELALKEGSVSRNMRGILCEYSTNTWVFPLQNAGLNHTSLGGLGFGMRAVLR